MIGDETGGAQIGGDLIALRMSEVIFAQAIRSYLESDASAEAGLAGFSNPHISRALDAFHKKPTEGWRGKSGTRGRIITHRFCRSVFQENGGNAHAICHQLANGIGQADIGGS